MSSQTLEDAIEEAELLLEETEELLKKYPDKFSLRVSKRNWSHRVDVLKKQKDERDKKS